jgi:hypothetical protein
MSVPKLVVVRPAEAEETPAARALRLHAEAKGAALEQVHVVGESLAKVIGLAGEIAEGGDVYPAGVRELARRLVDDLAARAATLDSLAQRNLDTH